MLSFADELATKVAGLIEDVGRLNMVSAIGFISEDDDLLRENCRHLSRGPWKYIELDRDLELDSPDASPLVVLVPERLPRSLIELVRAFVDKRGPKRSLVLLVNGVPDQEHIPPDLRRVACWEFVP